MLPGTSGSEATWQVVNHSLLPDSIWEFVLSLLPFAERKETIPLVCKQWAALTRTSRTIWQHCELRIKRNFPEEVFMWFATRALAITSLNCKLRVLPKDLFTWKRMSERVVKLLQPSANRLTALQLVVALNEVNFLEDVDLGFLRPLTQLRQLQLTFTGMGCGHGYGLSSSDTSRPFAPLEELQCLHYVKLDVPWRADAIPWEMLMLPLKHFELSCGLYCGKIVNFDLDTYDTVQPTWHTKLPKSFGKWCDTLETLVLKDWGSMRELPRGLPELKALKRISLKGDALDHKPEPGWVNIDFDAFRAFGQLPCLESLDLHGRDWVGVLPHLSGLTSLQTLKLARLCWYAEDECAMNGILTCPSGLRKLTVHHCGLRNVPDAVLNLARLTQLLLGAGDLSELPAGAYLGKLQHLYLSHNNLKRFPPALAACTALTHLSVSNNPLDDMDCRAVTMILERLPSLKYVSLGPQNAGLWTQADLARLDALLQRNGRTLTINLRAGCVPEGVGEASCSDGGPMHLQVLWPPTGSSFRPRFLDAESGIPRQAGSCSDDSSAG